MRHLAHDPAFSGDIRSAASSAASTRAAFIRRTYGHLAGAILAFVAIEWALLKSPLGELFFNLVRESRFVWLAVLGAFMAVGYLAEKWARSDTSTGMQYAGLGLYVVLEAVIFLPLLYVAQAYSGPSVIPSAGLVTLTLFAGLTGTVFITRKDFSFMRSILMIAGFVALGVIVASILFGFQLGIVFSSLMVILSGGYILYQTSNVLHHYRPDQHVAAALALFASVALMFWYIVQIFMSRDR